MKAIHKWIRLGDTAATWAKRVPGGMVLQVAHDDSSALTFVVCSAEQYLAFLEAHDVPMAQFEIITPSPQIVT